MKRRSFLKIIGLAVAAPGSLASVTSGAAPLTRGVPSRLVVKYLKEPTAFNMIVKGPSFAGWLRAQTSLMQDTILGKFKADLFRRRDYEPKLTGVFMNLDELRSAAR